MYCPLKKRQAFKVVYSQGKYSANELFVVYALANKTDRHRLGLSVSKKVGNAVVRNRIRRWLKENFRLMVGDMMAAKGYDLIIVARAPVSLLPKDGAFQKIGESVQQLFRKHGLFS